MRKLVLMQTIKINVLNTEWTKETLGEKISGVEACLGDDNNEDDTF